MQSLKLKHDIEVLGLPVTTFPQGIREIFDRLKQMFPPGDRRTYYGISNCTQAGVKYFAAASETYGGEAEQLGCERDIITKGDYLAVAITDWQKKTGSIKDVFEELTKDNRFIPATPLIELYKDMEEMVCMVSICDPAGILKEFDTASANLVHILSSYSNEKLNTVPFEGSWTVGQVAAHIAMSANSIKHAFNLQTKQAVRKPDEKVEELKQVFLNFDSKFSAPDFTTPAEKIYEKDSLVRDIDTAFVQLKEISKTASLYHIIEHPALGEISKFELLYFVVYHTQRHIHQIQNIAARFRK